MQGSKLWQLTSVFCLSSILLCGCATSPAARQTADDTNNIYGNLPLYHGGAPFSSNYNESKYSLMVPPKVSYGHEKVIIINPKIYAWGAYDEEGQLVRAGIANAGADYCKDEGHACRTSTGTFRVYSLGDVGCISRTYPIPAGGSLMPYCMFFHNGQSLHGTPDKMLVEANISHGCIHMRIPDAEWLRYNFVEVGTKVVVLPYQ